MSQFTFSAEGVKRLCDHLKAHPETIKDASKPVWLVYNVGIYLFAPDGTPEGIRIYADGCDPKVNPINEWFDRGEELSGFTGTHVETLPARIIDAMAADAPQATFLNIGIGEQIIYEGFTTKAVN